ncbi:ribosomal protein S18-alanine N-acetyltransferase [Alteromonas sp. CYL-A6]|uniref:ribosomal protein S18-alanine N-acetyltransferase n=1 Tax=Alteromonas nitratireducens TaxID=3390813 RepID=UPI0034C3194F
MIRCTDLTGDDVKAAYAIHQQVHVKPWAWTTFTDCLHVPYYGLAACQDNTLAGYALVLEVADEATLMDIAVSPDYRRQGIGNQLLNAVIARSRENQMSSLWLEVRAGNTAAITLYENAGFDTIEIRKNYYPLADGGKEDARIMRRCFI